VFQAVFIGAWSSSNDITMYNFGFMHNSINEFDCSLEYERLSFSVLCVVAAKMFINRYSNIFFLLL
jgi:hypothetical protein